MDITQFGEETKTLFLKQETHKLAHEFEVAAANTITKGSLVSLDATGKVTLAIDGAKAVNVIGYSIHDAAAGELCTVIMKAHTIVFASPNGILDAGAVAYDGPNDEDATYQSYDAPAVELDDVVGWALDAAAAENEIIRVALL